MASGCGEDSGELVCNGVGSCVEGACVCPSFFVADAQCKWKQWETHFVAVQALMLVLHVAVGAGIAWRLRTVWLLHTSKGSQASTLTPVWSCLCSLLFCLTMIVMLIDPDAHHGVFAVDPPTARQCLIVSSQLMFLVSAVGLVRFFGQLQARFHAPTRKAVRALDILLLVYTPAYILVFAVLIAVQTPGELFGSLNNALGAAFILALFVILRYFSLFVRDALSGAAAAGKPDYRAAVLRLRDVIFYLQGLMLLAVALVALFIIIQSYGGPLLQLYGPMVLRLLQLAGAQTLFHLFRPAPAQTALGSPEQAAQPRVKAGTLTRGSLSPVNGKERPQRGSIVGGAGIGAAAGGAGGSPHKPLPSPPGGRPDGGARRASAFNAQPLPRESSYVFRDEPPSVAGAAAGDAGVGAGLPSQIAAVSVSQPQQPQQAEQTSPGTVAGVERDVLLPIAEVPPLS